MSPTVTHSWKLWCLALHMATCDDASVRETLSRRSEEDRHAVWKRMEYIRKHKAIPVREFLE